MAAPARAYEPVGQYIEGLLPANLIDLPNALDSVWMEPPLINDDPFSLETAFLVDDLLELGIPGLDAVKLVIAAEGDATVFMVKVALDAAGTPRIELVDVPIALRFSKELLKPARKAEGGGWEADTTQDHVDITLAKVKLGVDFDGNIALDAGIDIDLPPAMIGNTGVVVEARDIKLYLDRSTPPPGKPQGWRGVHIAKAGLYLPGDLGAAVGSLELTDAYIGNGGFSGTVSDTWSPGLQTTLLGCDLELDQVSLTFVQNSLTASEIKGKMTVPFFDAPAEVDIGINLDGTVAIKLGASGGSGLVTIEKQGIIAMELDSLGFKASSSGFAVSLSGKLTPELGGLTWPTFELNDLEIDSHGHVHLAGGWLDLPSGYALDLFGFTIEISKVGFGATDDGGKWVGFSGGVKLVSGLPAGASVDGLRVTWWDGTSRAPQVTLNGVGIEFEVPDVLRFKGAVAYHELPGSVHRFDGALLLALEALDLEIDGQIVIGSTPQYTFLALYVGVELPAGIPLGDTGLALYGFAGLFALNMEPGKTTGQDWYAIPPTTPVDWFHDHTVGVKDLTKWTNREGSLGLGAGVTLGTFPDNGFIFNAKALLVIVFPGPIILIDGAANLLKERSTLSEEPLFRVLTVFDFRAGSIQVGLDVKYAYDDGGALIDVRGSADLFFSFADPSIWYIHVGVRDPKTRRIRAELFTLFEADAYIMLDPTSFAMGAWIGLQKNWDFGPVGVDLEAWIDGNALVSFKPAHFHGDLTLHGKAAVHAFGIAASLIANAVINADVFDPFHVVGQFDVAIDLPWPLPDFSTGVTLEWGPDPTPPPLPVPVKEIAIAHFKVSTSWPLPRSTDLFVPNYDDGNGFLASPAPANAGAAPPSDAPVVPLDCRPHVTFTRAVSDDALVGVNAQPRTPEWEEIGDPTKHENPLQVRYGLNEVVLERWDTGASAWHAISRAGTTANSGSVSQLYGSWAPVPAMPGGQGTNPGQTKLWLWSKTPFDSTRRTSGEWDDWFGVAYPNYPCVPPPQTLETCFDFSGLDLAEPLTPPWRIPGSGIRIGWFSPVPLLPTVLPQAVDGLTVALCASAKGGTGIRGGDGKLSSSIGPTTTGSGTALMGLVFDDPVDEVELTVVSGRGAEAIGIDAAGTIYGPFSGGTLANPRIVVTGEAMREVAIEAQGGFCLLRVCVVTLAPGSPEQATVNVYDQHIRDALATWSGQGNVLAPNRDYRIKVVTTLDTKDAGGQSTSESQIQYAFFRTEGPPGLGNLSLPVGTAPSADVALVDAQGANVGVDGSPASRPVLKGELNTLAPYVEQTVPPTVPAAGERPVLPRPVYRAYDVGVKFNEDYVDLLYRLDRRDLVIYLFDANNRPVRDAAGRLIALENPWGVAEALTLTESDQRWVNAIDAGDCATLDTTVIKHNTTLTAAAAEQVLLPDFVYEARLVPLLLHEDFSGSLGAWTVRDDGTTGGPSAWTIGSAGNPPSYYVAQTSAIAGPPTDPSDPDKPGTVLMTGDTSWTDVRVSAFLRSGSGGTLGLVFRSQGAQGCYRFSIDHVNRYRRLVRILNGVHTILAEDAVAYDIDSDILVTVEAVGPSLRVYLDRALLFDVADGTLTAGQVGLYCRGDATARFSDVRVDDLRLAAPVAYRFSFTTSGAANFAHQLHSFDDRLWTATIDPASTVDPDLNAALAAAVSPVSAQSDAEAKGYESLATLALGQAAAKDADRVEVARVERKGAPIALLVRSPEPLGWPRTQLELAHAARELGAAVTPGPIKLSGVTFGSGLPADAEVELMLREPVPLDGNRVEWRQLPGAILSPGRPALFADSFGAVEGVLLEETFGPAALDRYTIVDQGTAFAPSAWAVSNGRIVQTKAIFGGAYQAAEDGKPGTMALTGSTDWTNVRVVAGIEPGQDGAVGIVFRCADADNYYRFAIDARFGYRRLSKCVGGATTVLWQDSTQVAQGTRYELAVAAFGSTLVGHVDGELVFAVEDGAHQAGRVGLYSWLEPDARFDQLTAESVASRPLLWHPPLADVDEFAVTDEPGATGGPSSWAVTAGELRETSGTAGTWAAGGDASAEDARITARLRADAAGAIGVMFRIRSVDAYYRLSLDTTGYQLVKVSGANATVLWQDTSQSLVRNEWHSVELDAIGDRLSGTLDGAQLFSLTDRELRRGQTALYASGCTAARFDSIAVLDLARRAGSWRLRDESAAATGLSRWRIDRGALVQTSAISSTLALVEGRSWADARLTLRLRADDPHPIGAILRCAGPGSYYRFLLDRTTGARRLDAFVQGAATTLWSGSGGFPQGSDFVVTFDAAGDVLSGYVDGDLAFRVRDASLAVGAAGVFCSSNPALRVKHAEVEAPPPDAYALFADRFANGNATAFTVIDQGPVNGPSNWAVAGAEYRQTSAIHDTPVDSSTIAKLGTMAIAGDTSWRDVAIAVRLNSPSGDTIGVCFRYADDQNYYRLSLDNSLGYRRLVKCVGGTFTTLWEDGGGFDPARTYDLTIRARGSSLSALIDNTPLFTVHDGDVAAGAVGLYSWNNTDARYSDVRVLPDAAALDGWALDDVFTALRQDRYAFTDETAATGGPSNWSVSGNQLIQTVAIGAGGAEPELPGTYAVATEGVIGPDYRVAVVAGCGAAGAIGVVARYGDEDNFYRLSFDASDATVRLVRKVAGTATELWSATRRFDAARDYSLTLDVIGMRLACWLDGDLLGSLDDDALPAGNAGLYTAADAARFSRFSVGPTTWAHLYRFADEERIADGRRIALRASAPTSAATQEAGLDFRIAPAAGQRPWAPSPSVPLDLRIVSAVGAAVHERAFLEPSAFTAAQFSVVRKADRTAFFVVPAAGAELEEAGAYRLLFTYRRDNTAQDPASIVLSQAGDSGDEHAVLDVPWSNPTQAIPENGPANES